MPTDYLSAVKGYLRVTFSESDEHILELIADAMASLRGMIYPALEFKVTPVELYDADVNTLLKDYVRYAWNGSTQYFEEDYRSKITRLSLQIGASKVVVE